MILLGITDNVSSLSSLLLALFLLEAVVFTLLVTLVAVALVTVVSLGRNTFDFETLDDGSARLADDLNGNLDVKVLLATLVLDEVLSSIALALLVLNDLVVDLQRQVLLGATMFLIRLGLLITAVAATVIVIPLLSVSSVVGVFIVAGPVLGLVVVNSLLGLFTLVCDQKDGLGSREEDGDCDEDLS